jgi:ABC-type glycerol-3-phosphate transport system substrate-binding protein
MSQEIRKKLSRRHFLRLASLAAAGGVLAACTPETVVVEKTVEVEKVVEKTVEVEKEVETIVEKIVEVTPTAMPAPVRTEPIEVLVGSHWGGATGEAFQAMMDDYNANQGAEDLIKAVYITGGNGGQQITANRLAGTPIDTYNIPTTNAYNYYASSTILALPEDHQDYIKENFSAAWHDTAWFEGACLGYPSEFNVCSLFYRKSWLEEADVEPPETPQELREVAAAITSADADNPRMGYTFGYDTWHSGAHFSANIQRFSDGSGLFKWEGDTPVSVDITQDSVALAINYWLDMINDGSTNVGIISFDPSWQNGMAGMSEEAGWFPLIILRDAGLPEIYEDMGFAPQPVYPDNPPFARTYGRVMAVDSKSEYPYDVLKMLQTWNAAPDMPMQRMMVDYIGCAPSHNEYPFETIEWQEDMVNAYANDIIPLASFDIGYKALSYSEIRAKINPVMQGIMLGLNTVDDLYALQPELETLLERYDGPRWGG